MSQDDLEIDLDAIQRRMDGAMTALKTEFASLRTGRASASIVEPIQVEAYGQMTPINQLGTVNVPEPRMVVINVWDKAMISKVEKAIRESGIGINPVTDGPLIRLPIPELNEERRRQLTKVAAQYAESAKVAIRNVRRDGMEALKAAGVGLWDVIASAERPGSLDTAIRNVESADLNRLVDSLPTLGAIGFNGGTAARLGRRSLTTRPGIDLIEVLTPPQGLPQRSNTRYYRIEQMAQAWEAVEQEGELAMFWAQAPEDLRVEVVVLRG